MNKQQRDAFRVHHMVGACEYVFEFLAGKTVADLFNDRLLSSGVERQLEIIGEAASPVSNETQQQWISIDWKGMKGMRNFIAHEYFRPDYAKIWSTVQQVIPASLPLLRDLLAALEADFGGPEDDV